MHPPRRVVPGPPSNRAPVRTLARSGLAERRWLALSSACTRTGPARAVDIEGPGRRGGPRYGRVSPQDRDGTVHSAPARGGRQVQGAGSRGGPGHVRGSRSMWAAYVCRIGAGRRCGCVVGQTRPRRRRSDRAPQRWLGRTRRAGRSPTRATLKICGVAAEGGSSGSAGATVPGARCLPSGTRTPVGGSCSLRRARHSGAERAPAGAAHPSPRRRRHQSMPYPVAGLGQRRRSTRRAVRRAVRRATRRDPNMVSSSVDGVDLMLGDVRRRLGVPVRCCVVVWPPRR